MLFVFAYNELLLLKFERKFEEIWRTQRHVHLCADKSRWVKNEAAGHQLGGFTCLNASYL
jgi:hypothetical protein